MPRRRPPAPAEAFERAAAIFRAAGDVPRLRLLERLGEGECCVTELAAEASEALSTVSQRLRVLRAEGLVVRRREGKHIFYALADGHVAELIVNALEHAHEVSGARHQHVSEAPGARHQHTHETAGAHHQRTHEAPGARQQHAHEAPAKAAPRPKRAGPAPAGKKRTTTGRPRVGPTKKEAP